MHVAYILLYDNVCHILSAFVRDKCWDCRFTTLNSLDPICYVYLPQQFCISGWHDVPGSQKGSTENARGSGYDPAVEEITTGAKVKLNTQVHRQKQDTLDIKMLMN